MRLSERKIVLVYHVYNDWPDSSYYDRTNVKYWSKIIFKILLTSMRSRSSCSWINVRNKMKTNGIITSWSLDHPSRNKLIWICTEMFADVTFLNETGSYVSQRVTSDMYKQPNLPSTTGICLKVYECLQTYCKQNTGIKPGCLQTYCRWNTGIKSGCWSTYCKQNTGIKPGCSRTYCKQNTEIKSGCLPTYCKQNTEIKPGCLSTYCKQNTGMLTDILQTNTYWNWMPTDIL